MSNVVDLGKLNHRSKERIKVMGEVFTPEAYVEDMLDLLGKDRRGFWSDEETVFLEPCAGHGNIAVPVYRRRLDALYKKALGQGLREAPYFAVANALNTLWAIDIDRKNVENCRSRIFAVTVIFLQDKLGLENVGQLFSKKPDFYAHVLAAIRWHIDENETLSALGSTAEAKSNAGKTRLGARWLSQHGHKPLDVSNTWVSYFEECEESSATPIEYERATRFVDNVIAEKNRGYEEFEFAKIIIQDEAEMPIEQRLARVLSVGA